MGHTMESDGHGGSGVCLPPKKTHKYTIIWLHGLGDTGRGWLDFAESLAKEGGVFDHCKFILPTADSQPIAINMGMRMPAWANIHGLDASAPEDKAGWQSSMQRVFRIIETETSSPAIPAENVILGGFSQGGALAYLCALRCPMVVGGVVCFSGWLPMKEEFATEEMSQALAEKKTRLKMLHCHGEDDQLVALKWGKLSQTFLSTDLGMNVEFKSYAGLEHSACPRELQDAQQFLESLLK